MSGIERKSHTSTEAAWVRYTLIGLALAFMALFLVLPLAAVFAEALKKGWQVYLEAIVEPDALSAIKLTLIAAGIAMAISVSVFFFGDLISNLLYNDLPKALENK